MLGKAVESSDIKGLICKRCAGQHTQISLSQHLTSSSWKFSVDELQNNSVKRNAGGGPLAP